MNYIICFVKKFFNFDFQHKHKPTMKTVIGSDIHWIVLISFKEFNFKYSKSAATILNSLAIK